MKLAELVESGMSDAVAPFTGAWIETTDAINEVRKENVAPFTGAWIETVQ